MLNAEPLFLKIAWFHEKHLYGGKGYLDFCFICLDLFKWSSHFKRGYFNNWSLKESIGNQKWFLVEPLFVLESLFNIVERTS